MPNLLLLNMGNRFAPCNAWSILVVMLMFSQVTLAEPAGYNADAEAQSLKNCLARKQAPKVVRSCALDAYTTTLDTSPNIQRIKTCLAHNMEKNCSLDALETIFDVSKSEALIASNEAIATHNRTTLALNKIVDKIWGIYKAEILAIIKKGADKNGVYHAPLPEGDTRELNTYRIVDEERGNVEFTDRHSGFMGWDASPVMIKTPGDFSQYYKDITGKTPIKY